MEAKAKKKTRAMEAKEAKLAAWALVDAAAKAAYHADRGEWEDASVQSRRAVQAAWHSEYLLGNMDSLGNTEAEIV